jgi:uncharacterized protein with PIN domain
VRFLCDEMLAGLARLLRAAGHDAALAPDRAPDAALIAQAVAEDRRLVTRDRDLARQAGDRGVLVRAETAESQAEELSRVVPVDWSLAPFTRCLMDNAPLREATAGEVARMPRAAQARGGPFRACPACGRLYWPGSHVKRMAARLERLERLAGGAGTV